MLRCAVVTILIVSVTGYSVLDEGYLVLQSDIEELKWPESYMVKATKVVLTSNLIEDFTAWKTNHSSRIDYNQGAVKQITHLPDDSEDFGSKFEIHPETTEEELNKIVCHIMPEAWDFDLQPDEITPKLSEDESYEAVGNETIDEKETVKFEYSEKTFEKEVRKTVWVYYEDEIGWIPVRYEVKKYNVVLGALIAHEIWTYFDFMLDFDDDVFDTDQYGCDDAAVKHTADSEKITKELLFIDPENDKHFDHVFSHFQNKFERYYAHGQEHALRSIIFRENMRLVSSVNRRNLGYKLSINKFSDWTPEELKKSYGAIPRPKGRVGTVAFPYEESKLDKIVSEMPKEYDMRLFGLISPVKDQGTCGSCWTFAATAVTESGLAKINGGRVLGLSNQAIVDCAYENLGMMGAGGCDGGFDVAAYDFIIKHGLPTEEEYGPYKNRDGYCYIGNMTKTYSIVGYADVTQNNKNAMKVAVVNHGPLFIYVHVSMEFQAYSSGIFYQTKTECNPDRPNHAVTLVGYGERDGELFWILKNSWGTDWGIDGYMLVAAKNNVCGVASHPSYPVF